MGGEAVEGAAEGAGPGPLLLLAESVVVRPAVLAPWQELPAGSVHRRVTVLVHGGERRQRHPPRQPRRLQRVRVDGETCLRGPNRHWCEGFSVAGEGVGGVTAIWIEVLEANCNFGGFMSVEEGGEEPTRSRNLALFPARAPAKVSQSDFASSPASIPRP